MDSPIVKLPILLARVPHIHARRLLVQVRISDPVSPRCSSLPLAGRRRCVLDGQGHGAAAGEVLVLGAGVAEELGAAVVGVAAGALDVVAACVLAVCFVDVDYVIAGDGAAVHDSPDAAHCCWLLVLKA